MATVAERLASTHEELLTLYTTIPILTPCLDAIKTNQAQFVSLNNRIRQLQEEITTGHGKTDRMRKQLDWAFTLGKKADMERQYQTELKKVRLLESERRATLRQRDDVVTVKLTESVFDRSKDPVANADFPEELYWQLELKECDEKIGKSRQDLGKSQMALTALSRAANLSEAALMAFLGYANAAYKVWSAEYALQASRKMRLYLRVELSLSNAYSNYQSARAAVPSVVQTMDLPLPASSAQEYFEHMGRTGLGRKLSPVKAFDKEPELRAFITHLRSCHRTVERIVEQETAFLNGLTKYRDSVVPRLAKIRRHVFQESCLGGFQIEGWEDEQGRSLLGPEADLLVRGGLIEVHESSARVAEAIAEAAAEAAAAAVSGSFAPVTLSMGGSSSGGRNEGEGPSGRHSRRSSRGEVGDTVNGGVSLTTGNAPSSSSSSSSPHGGAGVAGHSEQNDEGQMIVRVGRAPLSTVAPNNQLGSQVLMEVDRDRRARAAAAKVAASGSGSGGGGHGGSGSGSSGGIRSKFWRRDGSRSRSRSRARSRSVTESGEMEVLDSQSNILQGRRGSGQPILPQSFSLSRVSSGPEDAVVPTMDDRARISSTRSDGRPHQRPTHRHNVPSLSISHVDDIIGGEHHQLDAAGNEARPRVMTMDEYVGVGEVERAFDEGHMDADAGFVYAYLDPTRADQHRSLPASSSRPAANSLTSTSTGGSLSSTSSSSGVYIPFRHNGRSLSISTLNADAEYGPDLIPSYGEHRRHRPLNPEDVFVMAAPPSASFGSTWMGDQPPPFSETNDTNNIVSSSHRSHQQGALPPTPPLSSSSLSSSSSTTTLAGGLHRLRSRSLSPSPHNRMPLLHAAQLGSSSPQGLHSFGMTSGLACPDGLGRALGSISDEHLDHLDHRHNPPPEYTA
ncbi:hypothetical protein DFQ26_006045 [Actinomortierella ambigua]|nr:hypothetical protein DFQ26_006045 [Actinomortierella ambigua]